MSEELKVEAGIEKVVYAINTGDENKPEFLKDEKGEIMKFKSEVEAELVISALDIKFAAVIERKEYVFSEEYENAMKKLDKESAEA
jgi:hypothetical protein